MRPTSGCAVDGSAGQNWSIANTTNTQLMSKENSSATGNVASPASFVSLPIDSNMQGLLLQMQISNGSIDLRFTRVASGTQTISAVTGPYIFETSAADAITAIEVQGTADFQWILGGNAG